MKISCRREGCDGVVWCGVGQIGGGPCHVRCWGWPGLGETKLKLGLESKNQDKNSGRYDSKTGAARLQVTHAPSYQISSLERREREREEISQNINPFKSALSLHGRG